MILHYNDIRFDALGRRETPTLTLKTLSERTLGAIPSVSNLKLDINFSELSELECDVAAVLPNGEPNPFYTKLTGQKIIDAAPYGVYVTENPVESGDGIKASKHIKAYSIEKKLANKRLFLEEGGYWFWNPATPDDTILGRLIEKAPGWRIGYVAPSLWNVFRMFDEYDDDVLNFLYGTLGEKYRCIAVCDMELDPIFGTRSINFYAADDELETLPIYLDYHNLIDNHSEEEKSDELVTALRPYGSDGLDITSVNPTGSAWIYDLSNFIANGDIPTVLAAKWNTWQAKIAAQEKYYTALISMRSSRRTQLLQEQAVLREMITERETICVRRNTVIQAQNAGLTPPETLATIASELAAVESRINAQEAAIAASESNITAISNAIASVVRDLSIDNTANFTAAERKTLEAFFIEQDLTEESFVASDVDLSVTGLAVAITSSTTITVTLDPSVLDSRTLPSNCGGGTIWIADQHQSNISLGNSPTLNTSSLFGGFTAYADVLSVWRNNSNNQIMATLTLRDVRGISDPLSSAEPILSLYGTGSASVSGSTMTITLTNGNANLIDSINDFQVYSVQRSLLEFAKETLHDLATPTYEISVSAANFLWAREFEMFRSEMALGKGVYLNVGNERVVLPIIGFTLDFEKDSSFELTLSRRFKRQDGVNTLKDMIEHSYSTSRSIDAAKHLQNLATAQASDVSRFMNDALDAAKNRILAAKDQVVTIDGAGVQIGEYDSNRQIAIANDMIAMTDDKWQHAKLAIGYFQTENSGNYFGVNAEVIAGKLIVGQNLIIDTGDGMFKVDGDGVYIDSLRFYVRPSGTGQGESLDDLLSDVEGIRTYYQSTAPVSPKVGDLWYNTTTGKTQRWSGSAWNDLTDHDLSNNIDTNGYLKSSQLRGAISATNSAMQSGTGNVLFDSKGIYLLNATTKAAATKAVWMNENGILFGSGTAGRIDATSGSQWTWTTAISHDGIVASAIAAGTISGMTISGGSITIGGTASNPAFRVDTNGNLTANSGTFKGIVQGATFKTANGTMMMNNGKWKADYLELNGLNVGNGQFVVDSNGNVSLGSNATIQWAAIDNAPDIPTLPSYIKSTKITSTTIESPTIRAGTFYGAAYCDTDGYYRMQLTGGITGGALELTNTTISTSVFKIEEEAYGESVDVMLFLGGKSLFYTNSRLAGGFASSFIWFDGSGLAVPYGTSTPGSSTPGYGKAGAVYFKI